MAPSQQPTAKAWVKNLLAAQGFALPEATQFWWGVHLEAFLRNARKRDRDIPLETLVADYLTVLRVDQPPIPTWRLEQARLALEVFIRGIEHWRWEADARGEWTPRFRLKCSGDSFGAARPDHPSGVRGPTPPQNARLSTVGSSRTEGAVTFGEASGPKQASGLRSCQPTPGDPGRSAEATIERLRREIRLAHYSWRTEQSYTEAVARFLKHVPEVAPESLTDAHVKAYLEHLAVERSVSASTQNHAFSAILFLFRRVLGRDLGNLGDTLRAKRVNRLPVVLSREEIARLFAATAGTTGLMIRLMYGTGMRLMECLQLRVKELDFDRNAILIRSGKGNKDRTVMQKPGLGVRSPLDMLGAGGGRAQQDCAPTVFASRPPGANQSADSAGSDVR